MADHNSSVSINISLDGAPGGTQGFGTALLLFEDASIHGGGSGDRVRSYADYASAEADAELPAGAKAAALTAFSQPTPPSVFKIGRKVPSSETWTEAITAVRAVDDNFYALAISSRTAADQELASAAIEATKKLAAFQSAEASLLTDTIATPPSAIFARERSLVAYHPTAAQWSDVAWLCNRLAFDPDTISAPWDCELGGVTAPPALTDGQYAFAIGNNVNVIAALDGATTYLDRGVNAKGRPVYELVTRDWFEARLQERVSQLRVDLSRRGQKLIINTEAGATTAQAYLLSIANGLVGEGIAAGHFVQDAANGFRALALTSTDIGLRRVRVTGQARLAVSGVLFTFTINFTRNALAA
jgi:hypothetical protein